MNKKSILLVDDEEDILEFLEFNFSASGYDVFTANNGKDAIDIAVKKKPDVIILDIMMTGMDGIQVCEKLKEIGQNNDSLIMFFTARGEDYSQIAGFDAGADDFVVKPISPKVLIKRVEALLKRKGKIEKEEEIIVSDDIKIGKLVIDREQYQINLNGKVIILPRKEFNLLELLASKQGKVFTRDEIFDGVWGDTFIGDRTIDVHIRKLREKLGEESIVTVKGIGYKINSTFFENC
ncbi:MAG: response regulator transcription factor [Bacteroidetes bacterium]|nr:response regulator transcription factor [Bacteroidota bacterium]